MITIGDILSIYDKLVKPHLKSTKQKELYRMIKQWFDEIDQNLNIGLNMDKLGNYEKNIDEYIKDKKLDKRIRCSKTFIKKYLREIGIKKECQDDYQLFNKYTRNAKDDYLDGYWTRIKANFYKFHANYTNGTTGINFADVEMPIKFLKFYWRV